MDKKYIQLFIELTKAMAVLAEQVMDYNHKQNDSDSNKAAQIMRDDFQKLHNKMTEPNFNPTSLERADFAKLLVGAFIVMQNIEDQIKSHQKAVEGYKIDLIPKLDRIVNESNTTEEAIKLAEEIFQIIDKENN